MGRSRIRLKESQLRSIVKETVMDVLLRENADDEYLFKCADEIISIMGFNEEDIEDEVDFYYECQYVSEGNEALYERFYRIVDLLKNKSGIGIFDASNAISDLFNKLIAERIGQ